MPPHSKEPADHYGIPEALRIALRTFEFGARRSGRTQRMLATLKPGDVVVTIGAEAHRLRDLARDLGLQDVRFVSVDPERLDMSRLDGVGAQRIQFDHEWLRRYFEGAVNHSVHWLHKVAEAYGGRQREREDLGPMAPHG